MIIPSLQGFKDSLFITFLFVALPVFSFNLQDAHLSNSQASEWPQPQLSIHEPYNNPPISASSHLSVASINGVRLQDSTSKPKDDGVVNQEEPMLSSWIYPYSASQAAVPAHARPFIKTNHFDWHSWALKTDVLTKWTNVIRRGHPVVQVGVFSSAQGKAQNIAVESLIGDRFNVSKRHGNNALLGIGYQMDGLENNIFNLAYGINAFYLPNTLVKGTITQEYLFTNLAYHYSMSHLPIFAMAKAYIKNNDSTRYVMTLDAGVGPNFNTSRYDDESIDGGITIPDHAFLGRTSVSMSAMAGFGLKINNALATYPLELGYRFFYLGESHFNPRTSQVLNALQTGSNNAQSIVLSMVF